MLVERMAATLGHRGPDGSGTWSSHDRRVCLAHHRLSIIDLALGAQPMASMDGRFTITYNGEIYNYQRLRLELSADGARFATHSDTEVILEAYRRWGVHCVDRLHGIFAFAIWDNETGTLYLARDRTGVKPLYIFDSESDLYFGSEIKALLAVPQIPRRIDYRAIAEFVVLGYACAPRSAFRNIQELKPGTWHLYSERGYSSGEFWAWHSAPSITSLHQAVEEVENALTESISEQLVSDVPIGAFLSGGIDSSLIVAIAARLLNSRLKTFTVGFGEKAYDESGDARRVAELIGTDHHEIRLPSSSADLDLVNKIIDQFDQPFGDSSAIPSFLICREISKSVKVALAGDGGDEMFGGYSRFSHADLTKRISGSLGPTVDIGHAAAQLGRYVMPDRARRAARLFSAAAQKNGYRLAELSAIAPAGELARILTHDALQHVGGWRPSLPTPETEPSGGDFVQATIRAALPGDYLRKVDITSSAHGLEVRVPFLGEPVLDVAQRIPPSLNYDYRTNKKVLRRLAARLLPPEIARKPKAGFGIPLDSWLDDAARAEIASAISSPNPILDGLVRRQYRTEIGEAFRHRRWNRRLYSRYGLYQRAFCLWSLARWADRWRPCP